MNIVLAYIIVSLTSLMVIGLIGYGLYLWRAYLKSDSQSRWLESNNQWYKFILMALIFVIITIGCLVVLVFGVMAVIAAWHTILS